MSHRAVYELFRKTFPVYSECVVSWGPIGRNSVKVRLQDNADFVFSYLNDREWQFETIEHFNKNNLERSKNNA